MPLNASPWDLFGDDNLSFIERRKEDGGQILPSDLLRILEAQPELIPDPLFREYVGLALAGQLKPKRGRPTLTSWQRLMLIYADVELPARAKAIRAARKVAGTGERGMVDPMVQAADEFGREWGVKTYGRALLNARSARKRQQLIVRAPSRFRGQLRRSFAGAPNDQNDTEAQPSDSGTGD